MKCCKNEKWIFIKGFEPFYKISSCGRIKSCKTKGKLNCIGKWHDIKQFLTPLHKGHRCLIVYLYKNAVRVVTTVHKLVFENFKKEIRKGLVIDHINRDSLDNHLKNLRAATQGQNQINCKNKFSGVSFDSNRRGNKKYKSVITINGKQIYLGRYCTSEEAYKVRKEAELKYYGEFSNKLN